jgi:hypothetical protein
MKLDEAQGDCGNMECVSGRSTVKSRVVVEQDAPKTAAAVQGADVRSKCGI